MDISSSKNDNSSEHNKLIKFLVEKKSRELELILKRRNSDVYHSLYIHSQELLDVSTFLFTQTIADPDKWLLKLDADLIKALDNVYEAASDTSDYVKKEKVHLRISNLPAIPWFQKKTVPRCYDDGDVIQLVGTVTKSVQPKLLTWRHDVTCQKCGYTCPVEADYDQFYQLPNSGKILLSRLTWPGVSI